MNSSQNELLRSAYQIAKRGGKDTNWEAFTKNLKSELLNQAGCYDDGKTPDEQTELRSTCTALTFKNPTISEVGG